MSDRINLLERVEGLEVSPEFDGYTRVVIWLDEKDDDGNDKYVEAGTETGRTLELTCPWGTKAIASAILQRINVGKQTGRAFQYQPYTASGAILDPAAELGDGIGVKDIYSGLYSQTEYFSMRHLSDIAAPTEEEIDHEYPFESADSRKVDRKFSLERAERISELKVHLGLIEARVSKTYDNKTNTYGWRLLDDQFTVYSQTGNVLKVTQSGLTVTGSGTFSGRIEAKEGYIGSFNIVNGTLRTTKTDLTDNNNGVFISASGIALGPNNAFKVTSTGNLSLGAKSSLNDNQNGVYICSSGIALGPGNAFKVTSAGNLSLGAKANLSDGNAGVYICSSGISLGANEAFKVDSNGNLSLGKGAFKVNSSGALDVNNGAFQVFNTGSVRIKSGDISINNGAFHVDTNGNLTANSGTFKGNVYAKNVKYGGDYGTMNGGGLTGGTVAQGKLDTSASNKLNHGQKAFANVRDCYVGNYKLNFGSGIVIQGAGFKDSTGKACSGSVTNSAVVTCSYKGNLWPD